jgi:LuxR family maltose regulon positive regulatory protein
MAVLPPPLAKISRPVPKGCLPRKRLFRLVDRSFKKAPLLWVCGPPGCGKTTLVSTYVGTRMAPALWYKFDEGDDDLASFFYYLGVAGKRAAPRMRKSLPVLTPEYLGGIQEFTRTRLFFENLFARLPPGRALVFDDYQEIPAKSPLHDAIVTGLSRAPEGTTVFLLSRRGPPPVFARYRVNNRLEMIGWEDLRLTLAECRDIARLRGKKRQSGKGIRHLHEMTDGWAAGLVLMLERSRSRSGEPPSLPNRTPRELFDYFGGEIYGRLGKPVREFLLKTAFLPDMTATAAEALTGQRRAPQLLSYLSGNNLFLTEHLHSEPLYRYHPLFREFLLSRARESLGKKEMHALKRRAAALLERTERVGDAAGLFSDIGDHESLARLTLSHAASLLAQGRNRMLEEWLGRLPENTIQENPWLLFWLGASRMPFDPIGSRGHTERAFEQFFERKDTEGTFLSWSMIIDNLCMYLNDFQALDEWIDRFDRITERFSSFPSPEIEARAVASMLGGLYMRRVDHPDIETWVNKASDMIQECKDVPVRLQASLYLFLYFIWIGEFPRARGIVESTRQWISSSTSYPQRKILFHLFEARLHCGIAQFDDSIRSVGKGLEIARASGMHLWDFLFFAEGAAASLGKGDLVSASSYLRQMGPFLRAGQTLNQAYFHHLSSWHAALNGDIPLALSHENTADALVTDCGAPCGIALGKVFMARLENELGNTENSSGHLEKASRIARGMRSPILEYQVSLVEADIAFLQGDEESGLACLRKALSIGREKGYFHYDNWIPSFMTRLCVKALEEGLEVPYVQELIRRRKLVPESPPLEVETWPWPVRIYTLGRFGILKDGKPLAFSRKMQKRPLSLLKALIAFGGRAAREDQITDAVWPEAEGDMAVQAMSVALRRLRQLLGYEEAVQRREGILRLDPRYCWVDAFAFERLLGKAASLGETGREEGAATLEEKALALYRGPFLAEDVDRSWPVSMRERLRSRYLLTVGRLGARLRQAGQWEKARECYQRGIDVDNLAEEFYQSLMSCYLANDRKAEALVVYDRLKKTFSSLGVEPSPKTRDLLGSRRPI